MTPEEALAAWNVLRRIAADDAAMYRRWAESSRTAGNAIGAARNTARATTADSILGYMDEIEGAAGNSEAVA